MNKILKLLGVIIAVCYCQTAVCQDSVKAYLKVGGTCDILPSEKLQYFSFQSKSGVCSNNKDYRGLSASALGGVEFGLCRLEAGVAFSVIDMEYYDSRVTAKDVAIPMSFSVRMFRVSGFGFYLAAAFAPHKIFDYHNTIDGQVFDSDVENWGMKAGLFLEVDKNITRSLSVFVSAGLKTELLPSRFESHPDHFGLTHYSPMYLGNTINVSIGLLGIIDRIVYKNKKSGE